ncbi:hypothetical protein [Mycobacterium sp. 23]|uniref:hypothetical protein n=1 Tax=Mycobacterium sp. 23 TaxID=3400424 RepID=UPI003AAACF30
MSWKLFDARYPGRCDANGCRFEQGDRIGYADGYDRPLCESCWCADKEETTPPQVCSSCFTIHAGECL